jgi:hypothetical protein
MEKIYDKLVLEQDISRYSIKDSLRHIGTLIDLSLDLRKPEGLDIAIKQCEHLEKQSLSDIQLTELNYFLSNAWANKYELYGKNRSWNWEQDEIGYQIINLRKALNSPGFNRISKLRRCQILTNLGNLLDHIGRFVDAIDYWDRALIVDPKFPMALGNRAMGITNYANALYDNRHKNIFYRSALSALDNALKYKLPIYSKEPFENYANSIKSMLQESFPENCSHCKHNRQYSLGRSIKEKIYRKWCLDNRLFLNPLNDLGSNTIAAADVISMPSIVYKIDEGPYYDGFYNQLKQEYVSSRYLYYEGITPFNSPHFSDKRVILVNTLDYPAYSLSIEKIKIAFRVIYSIFDKIAYFLNDYLEFSIPEKNVNFRTIWYESQNQQKGLRNELREKPNWPLRGLFWLSKDLFDKNIRESIEPEAQKLNIIRNHIEHKYFKLHTEYIFNDQSSMSPWLSDKLAYSMFVVEFEELALRLIKLARGALIYLSLAVHQEELYRSKKEDRGKILNLGALPTYDDSWKL